MPLPGCPQPPGNTEFAQMVCMQTSELLSIESDPDLFTANNNIIGTRQTRKERADQHQASYKPRARRVQRLDLIRATAYAGAVAR